MKENPKCQLGRFCPEPFNYCPVKISSFFSYKDWWGILGKTTGPEQYKSNITNSILIASIDVFPMNSSHNIQYWGNLDI